MVPRLGLRGSGTVFLAVSRRHFRALACSPVDRSSPLFVAKEAANTELSKRLKRTEIYVERGGGEKAVQRHVQKNGKVLVRDRVRMLRDAGQDPSKSAATATPDSDAEEASQDQDTPSTFLEIGKLAGLGLYHPKLGGDVQCAGVSVLLLCGISLGGEQCMWCGA